MITPEDFINHNISEFVIDNRDNIPLLGSVIIDDSLYGNFDIIINRHYGGEMKYLPLLLDFNDITDMVDVRLGMLFKLPDISALSGNLTILKELDKVPGVSDTMNNLEMNMLNSKTGNKSSGKTTAQPKLKITLPKVSYDNESGTLKF